MRAVLIDPEQQTLTEIQISADDRKIYEFLGCRNFLQVRDYLNDSDLLLIDVHKLGADGAAFVIDAPSVPITGRGMALGNDSAGKICDLNISLDELRSRITFTTYVTRKEPIFYQ